MWAYLLFFVSKRTLWLVFRGLWSMVLFTWNYCFSETFVLYYIVFLVCANMTKKATTTIKRLKQNKMTVSWSIQSQMEELSDKSLARKNLTFELDLLITSASARTCYRKNKIKIKYKMGLCKLVFYFNYLKTYFP